MITEDTDDERIILEVSGQYTPLLRNLLSEIKLNGDIENIRIEITGATIDGHADEPTPETTDTPETTETADETKDMIREGLGTGSDESDDGGNGAVLDDSDIESNEPPILWDENPELSDLPEATLNPGSAKWIVASTLYERDGFLPNSRIHAMLRGTDWERPKGSISAALSNLFQAGIISRKKKETGSAYCYQLTQFGRDLVAATADERDASTKPDE